MNKEKNSTSDSPHFEDGRAATIVAASEGCVSVGFDFEPAVEQGVGEKEAVRVRAASSDAVLA